MTLNKKYSLMSLLEKETRKESVKLSDESVDDQIDEWFSKFEKSSIEMEGESEESERKLKIKTFSKHVNRLIENYDSLLDIENVIISRAKLFLEDNYGKEAGLEYEDVMDKQFGIDVKSKSDSYGKDIAVGAGPISGG